jgi:hypothetical protein
MLDGWHDGSGYKVRLTVSGILKLVVVVGVGIGQGFGALEWASQRMGGDSTSMEEDKKEDINIVHVSW